MYGVFYYAVVFLVCNLQEHKMGEQGTANTDNKWLMSRWYEAIKTISVFDNANGAS